MATVELYQEFYEKYADRLLGNLHSNDIRAIIKEIYEAGFEDGQKFVYATRYGNMDTLETTKNSITCIKADN